MQQSCLVPRQPTCDMASCLEQTEGRWVQNSRHFSLAGRSDRDPVLVNLNTEQSELEGRFENYKVNIDLDTLWAACPVHDLT